MGKEKNIKYSRHHLLPRHPYGKDCPENIVLLKHNYHQALHTLFANQMIAEQLLTTIDISAKALREDVREWLVETLMSKNIDEPYEWYKPEVIR